jgi:GTP cyclohydrolase II
MIGARAGRFCLASADLPIYGGRDMKIHVFGRTADDAEVVAIVHRRPGAPDSDEATVRLHSVCLTGDVFGSAKCDCGAQLRLAIDAISAVDHGIVLYLMRHEGRGIGLVNKIKAYALQDAGLDTVEANRALGFAPDLRDFTSAAEALRELGVTKIRLLTNNPDKVAQIERSGIEVLERVTLDTPMTEHNRDYLDTKRRFFGHLPARDPASEALTPHAFAELFAVHDAVVAPSDVWAMEIAIDSFHHLRDALGLEAANAMMFAVSRRMKQTVRADEMLAREDDDRIFCMLRGVSAALVNRIADRVRYTFRAMTFSWRGRNHAVTARVTVSRMKAGEDLTSMLSHREPVAARKRPQKGHRHGA